VNFASYFLVSSDMDFIRLNGSVLFFGLVWGCVWVAARWLFRVGESRLSFLTRFGLDLMEVKVLHSFWSAVLLVIVNYK